MADVSAKDGSQVSSRTGGDGAREDGVGRCVRLAHNLGVWAEAAECSSGEGWETCRKMWVLPALTFRLGNQV